MHSKSHVHPIQNTVRPKHIALDIKSEQTIGKILPFTRPQNLNMALKNKSRSSHQISLENSDQMLGSLDVKKLTKSFKHIKSLECLRINLDWLPKDEKNIHKIIQSFINIKTLKTLDFYNDQTYSIHLGKKIDPLYKALKKIRLSSKIEIKLSLFLPGKHHNKDFTTLFKRFSKLKLLKSADLTFLDYANAILIADYLETLNGSKSLTNLSVSLSLQVFVNTTGFDCVLDSFAMLKSLKHAKIRLRQGLLFEYQTLIKLLPFIKKIGQIANFDFAFDSCRNAMSHYEWKGFVKSISNLGTPHTVRAKYIGSHKRGKISLVVRTILIMTFLMSIVMLPMIPMFVISS